MKNFTILLIFFIQMLAFSQVKAKKPTLMVVPSDNWCFQNGFTMELDNQGVKTKIPLYRTALQENSDLNQVISKINGLLSDRGFDAKDLNSQLKKLESNAAEQNMRQGKETGAGVAETPVEALKNVAKADIIIQMSWTINDGGLEKSVSFTLDGLDSYTGKQIAQASGTGAPDFSSPLPVLLEEAVLSKIDEFLNRLQNTFETWFEKGREMNLGIRVWDDWGYDLESGDFGDEELSFIIQNWLDENTVNGAYTTMDAEETMMNFEQVRIPMLYMKNDKEKALDARTWGKGLSDFLMGLGVENKLTSKGLGEVTIYLGGK